MDEVSSKPVEKRIAIRTLAEWVHRRGDLYNRLDSRTRADEGIRTQRQIQLSRTGSYQVERPVQQCFELAGLQIRLSGRIDGCDLSARPPVVEEIKTSRADHTLVHQHSASINMAQAKLYAALLSAELPEIALWTVRLVYAHPDSGHQTTFDEALSAQALAEFLRHTLQGFEQRLRAYQQHCTRRDEFIFQVAFPHGEFRPNQRALASRCYQAVRDREHLIVEAPTGSGKSVGVAYPAIKALAQSDHEQIFFLTSRSTGADAARSAFNVIDGQTNHLRRIHIQAKHKVCPVEGQPCDADLCGYARGYYDRRQAAVTELLECVDMSPGQVSKVSEGHQVCPFELSLDAALWADLVIVDYNYVFDPVVRLQRFAANPAITLLIDEAHQLSTRVCDMLSLQFDRSQIRNALAEKPRSGLTSKLKAMDRALLSLSSASVDTEETRIELPEALFRVMDRFLEETSLDAEPIQTPACRDVLFECLRFSRAQSWVDAKSFVSSVEVDAGTRPKAVCVRVRCLDASAHIAETLNGFGANIRFSGTMTPLDLYRRLHGLPETKVERVASSYSQDQLLVQVVTDVPTYLNSRKQSLYDLVSLVKATFEASAGHCLIAFPSYAYLEMFVSAWQDASLRVQQRQMSEADRDAFIAEFTDGKPPLLGVIVLGGVFSESVDYSATSLKAVIVVGVGLPPPSLIRQAQASYFDDLNEDGTAIAYLQPAMTKVLQVAGRLLRSPDDKGVLCLIDPRFAQAAYRQFFPGHWRPIQTRAREVSARIQEFWRGPAV